MPQNFKNYLTGKLGESLVVAELARRHIVATAFSGNLPDMDILAYLDGASVAIQVKTWRGGGVQFDARRFLAIDQVGERQEVRDLSPLLGVGADRDRGAAPATRVRALGTTAPGPGRRSRAVAPRHHQSTSRRDRRT